MINLIGIEAATERVGRSVMYLRLRDHELAEAGVMVRTVDRRRTRLYDIAKLDSWVAAQAAAEVTP